MMPAMRSYQADSLYSYDEQTNDVMLALNRQRQVYPVSDAIDLCDVIVYCQFNDAGSDQQPIRAHRCVLATSSEYFQTYFSSRLDKSVGPTAVEVHLPFVSRDVASKVIDFLYTGSVRLSSFNDVTDVLRLADFLRINRLLKLCSTHLSACVNSTNVIVIRHLIDTFNLTTVAPDLAATVGKVMSQHLPDIVRSLRRSRRLCRRLPPDVIMRLLNDDESGSVREKDIYDVISHYASVNEDQGLASKSSCRSIDLEMAPEMISSDVIEYDRWNLLECVEFDYLPTKFLCNNVLTNATVVDWLRRNKPETLRYLDLRQRMAAASPREVVDIIVCRSRSVKAFDRHPVQLVVYDVTDDTWRYLHPSQRDAVSLSLTAAQLDIRAESSYDEYSLDGLESMVIVDGVWLYVLCSTSDDEYCHSERPVEKKRFQCYDMQCHRPSWIELPVPVVVQSRCRLVYDNAEFIYAVDREGRVERFSISSVRWTVLCRMGFTSFPHATLYVLPIPLSAQTPSPMGDGRGRGGLFIVRVFSSGYSFYFTSKSVAIYRLNDGNIDEDSVVIAACANSQAATTATDAASVRNEWDLVERSEIEMTDLVTSYADDPANSANVVHFHGYTLKPGRIELTNIITSHEDDPTNSANVVYFHGYTLKPGRIELTDELGRPRASFDLTSRDWIQQLRANGAQQCSVATPRFVGTVLATASHAGRTYCTTRTSDAIGGFVMYDHGHGQYKALSTPPLLLSGVICRANLIRSALERLVPCKSDEDVVEEITAETSDMEFDISFEY